MLVGLEACGPAAEAELPGGTGLAGRFLESAKRHALRAAVVTPTHRHSFAQLAAAAWKVSAYLQSRPGFLPGDRVATLIGNTPEYVAAYYGILLAGGIAVPLPPTTPLERLDAILTDCQAATLLADPAVSKRIPPPSPADNVPLDLAAPAAKPRHGHEPATALRKRLARPPRDAATILYTSGSTGSPKGVLLSHRNLVANAESILDFLPIRASDRALALLPFCHAYGNSVLQTHMLAGATLVLDGSPTFPMSVVDALERHRATSLAAVPELIQALLACTDLRTRRLPALKYLTVAGAALAPGTAIELADLIAPAELYTMYGQTEATARLAYLSGTDLRRHPGSIGKAIRGVELQVQDKLGQPLRPGATGELCARGASVMLGYWNDPQATAETIRAGWLRTGDLATVDAEGFFFLAGRRNEQLKIRGLKVLPQEIEESLASRLPNCELAVVPFKLGDAMRLALFVSPNGPPEVNLHTVRRTCHGILDRHQTPSHVEIVDEMPRTTSMKADRCALAARAAESTRQQLTTGIATTRTAIAALEEHE